MDALKIGLVHMNVRHNQPDANMDELMHPETVLAAAKLGCDLAVLSSGMELSAMRRQTIAARSVDQLYIAVAGADCAFICEPPESHYSWKEVCADGSGICSLPQDFVKSRNKRFYDRLDFDLLLRNGETI